MKRAIAALMSLIMVLLSTNAVFAAGYPDVKQGNWAYDAVSIMSDKAVVKGFPDGSFKPDSMVTCGEFIKMALITATGEDIGNASGGHWALNYYKKALELKYFTEYDIDGSQLGDEINRAHMALIISAILGEVTIENYDAIQAGIADITTQTKYEYDITKAYASGILTGYTDSTFRPTKTLSRAEAAMVIYRLADKSKRVYPGEAAETPKTTAERMQAGESDSGTINLIESSESTLMLDELVTNRADFRTLENVRYYEVVEDYPYTMSKWKDLLGIECVVMDNMEYSRGAFIIKDKKLTMLSPTAGYIYQVAGVKTASPFPDFEYIGFYNSNHDTVILIPNPF
jgi:hypothetical protein